MCGCFLSPSLFHTFLCSCSHLPFFTSSNFTLTHFSLPSLPFPVLPSPFPSLSSTALSFTPLPFPQPGPQPDLLGTSGDYLRIWKVSDGEARLECMLNNVRTGHGWNGGGGVVCEGHWLYLHKHGQTCVCTHRHTVTHTPH